MLHKALTFTQVLCHERNTVLINTSFTSTASWIINLHVWERLIVNMKIITILSVELVKGQNSTAIDTE